ncbi:MAG: hypothetical protein ACYDC6_05985 [Acidobacteriaceae bacterium]
MSVAEKIGPAAVADTTSPTARVALPDDGTRQLLRAGSWIVVVGLLALLATFRLFGGIGIYGARSNAGWLSLMFAMMGTPFGLMLLTLGVAKWLRNRRLQR